MNQPQIRSKHLVLAALLAGAAGLAVIALGWWIVDWQLRADWGRLTEPSWWTGTAVRSLGHLIFSKVGFKIALVGVISAAAGIAWLRARRRREADAEPES